MKAKKPMPWWGPAASMAVIVSTWAACVFVGILYGAPLALGLFILIELRAVFAGALQDWRRESEGGKDGR